MNPIEATVELAPLGKVWKRINIWEVSACGIPMYPKAHKSFSLVKALQESEDLVSDELNEGEKPMEDSEKPEEEKTEGSEDSGSESEKPEEEKPAEAPAEAAAEAPAVKPGEAPEEAKEGEESEGGVDKSAKVLQDAIVKGFRIAIKEAQTERGLVSEEKSVQEKMGEELKKKSIGELAVMSGLFQKPPVVGSTREFE